MTLTVSGFATSAIFVAGDVMVDRYWLGPTSRISPEAPVRVVDIQGTEEPAGGAASAVALSGCAKGGPNQPQPLIAASLRLK